MSPKAGVRLEPEVIGVPFQLGRRVRAPFILALLPGGLEPHDLNAQSLELRLPSRGDVDTRCRRSIAGSTAGKARVPRERSAYFFSLYCMDETTNYTYITLRRGNLRRGGGRRSTERIPLTPCQAAKLCMYCCTTLKHAYSSVLRAHVLSLLHVAPVSDALCILLLRPHLA